MLESIEEKQAKRIIPAANITFISAERDISRVADELTAGKPWWRLFAWIVLFVLLAEFIIANRLFMPKVSAYIDSIILIYRRFQWAITTRQ